MTEPRLQSSPPDVNTLIGHYTDKAVGAGVPEHLIDGLVLYIVRGVQPGYFLQAVLSNDLINAMGRADVASRAGLYQLTLFLYNDAPCTCWGSPSKVTAWANVGGMYGVRS